MGGLAGLGGYWDEGEWFRWDWDVGGDIGMGWEA